MSSLRTIRERRQRQRAGMLPHARTTDPATSHESAAITEETTLQSEIDKVVEAVSAAGKRGFAPWELEGGKYWRRFSDAKRLGLIFATDRERRSPITNRFQTIYVVKEHLDAGQS